MSIATVPSYPSYPCETGSKLTIATASLNSPGTERNDPTELFSRLDARHHWQQAHLEQLSVSRTYQVENSKNKMVAEEIVVMKYRAPGTETFTITSGKGSEFVRHHVFERLMKHEAKRVRANKDPDSLITAENYTLEVIGTDRIGASDCSVVHAIPRRKATDLFEGKLWIDNQDFAIVRITGRLAKSPSFWIKHVDFVRDYGKVAGFWLLTREKAVSAVRVFGKETLTVDYQNYTVEPGQSAKSGLVNARQAYLNMRPDIAVIRSPAKALSTAAISLSRTVASSEAK